ncbi:MAG: hypothetical protein ACUVQF_09760 [Fervidobacterium sp.]|uniref:hypothetical protein n=1 Tax=Fervidobacterium sp. TaxID=1871331 RepID=UPI00404A1D5D
MARLILRISVDDMPDLFDEAFVDEYAFELDDKLHNGVFCTKNWKPLVDTNQCRFLTIPSPYVELSQEENEMIEMLLSGIEVMPIELETKERVEQCREKYFQSIPYDEFVELCEEGNDDVAQYLDYAYKEALEKMRYVNF